MDERTQLLFHHSRGRVLSGTKLGAIVGQHWARADASMRRYLGTLDDDVLWSEGCDGDEHVNVLYTAEAPVLHGRTEASYRDRGWQNGVILLCLQDGRVQAITWNYAGPFYIDL